MNRVNLLMCVINGLVAFSLSIYFELASNHFHTSYFYFLSLLIVSFTLFSLNKSYSIISLFVLSYILLFYIYPMTEVFFNFDTNYPDWIKVLYTQVCISSLHAFMFGYLLLSKKDDDKFILIVNKDSFNKSFYLFFIVSIFSCVLMFESIGGLSASSLSRVDLKYVSGGKIYALWLIYFSAIFYFMIPIYFKINNNRKWLLLIFIPIIIFLEYVYFIGMRNRTIPIMHLTSIACSLYLIKFFKKDDFEKENIYYEKLKTKKFIITALFLGMFGIFIRFARGVFLEGDGELNLSLLDMIKLSIEKGDLGYTSLVYDVFLYVNENNIMLNGQSYIRAIATFIPSFIWEDKPPTTQSLIGQWLTGIDVMTIPPSIFGDAYLNFGVVGFTIFILFGFLISMMDNINDKYIRLAMYSIVFVLVFHFVRGAFVNPLVALVFVYLGVFASKKIIQPTIVKVV
ncbi:TPA: oligosaccharide repeat unit polymerase [Vibrio parahaemolyticus]|nr:oligosaccharide repeat unit polymerase [Vibrio parahaemolyticus]